MAAYIDPADRPRVREGQFVGRVGNSGQSGGAHLHMSMKPVIGTDSFGREELGDSIPMRFRQSWGHEFISSQVHAPEGWYRHRGTQVSETSPQAGSKSIHSSPYLRRTDAASGNLKLIAWDQAGDGKSILRLDSIDGEAVTAIAIARAKNFDGIFTAVRDGQGELRVIPWVLSADGLTFTRGAEVTAGPIRHPIAVTSLEAGVAVGISTATEGDLKVIAWSADSGGNIGERQDDYQLGMVTEIRMLEAPTGDSNFTTVVRDGSGNLRLIGWGINHDGTNLRRVGVSDAGPATRVSAAVIKRNYEGLDPRDMILTSVRDGQGDLKLITWDTNLVNP